MCFPLIYSIAIDPDRWDDPMTFRPERHMTSDGKFNDRETFLPLGTGNFSLEKSSQLTEDFLTNNLYYLGRRKCLGESLAKVEVFLIFANLFKTFKMSGKVPDISKPVNGLAIAPQHFDVQIEERIKD